ncbi:hypothetical protein MBLNU13_g01650t1 [Cladosporium sp. NU13]
MASEQCPGVGCDYAKLRKLGTDMITIVVGADGSEEEFFIYADLAKRHSKVFETNIQLATGPEKSRLRATKHSGELFKIFVWFVYTGRIHTTTKSTNSSEWRLLSELWVLGQALESTTFKDAVVDAMLERRTMFNEFHDKAYVIMSDHLQTQQQTRAGVGKLLVDTAVSARQHEVYTDRLSSVPACLHFYGEVIKGLNRIRRRVETEQEVLLRATKGLDCVYHEHGASETCHRKMFPVTRGSVRHSQGAMPQIEKIMIEVRVGSGDEIEGFILRKNLATRHSDVIRKAFAGGWKEAKENMVRFPEESPEAFQMFVTFLDTGVIHLCHFKSNRPVVAQEVADSRDVDEEWKKIAEAWLLGERLCCTSFKDALVDKMVHILQTTAEIPKTMLPKIITGSVARSGMRDLLVDLAAYHLFAADLEDQPDNDRYASYWKQVAIACRHRITNPSLNAPYDNGDVGCRYHDHGKGNPCYKLVFT